ncbi:hypothetical protein H2O64_17245 [Kordia sp. YSTF-M3]|uniref:Uncharacterized protein n=1 Tax=Kordia aestuariivivens TaxID=2759037 RepID=A0ABR7QD18_9FLAO|nr:hypothetical protein [Kordia aestuariivivens]MBC8756423.1 hypothetical protein [Kordia aestuariivivens]
MPKPKGQKNTKNKAKHTKLLQRKLNKERAEKEATKARLKAIVQKAKEKNEE